MSDEYLHGKKGIYFFSLYLNDLISFCFSVFLSYLILYGFSLDTVYYVMIPNIRLFLFTLLVLMINYSHYDLYKDKRNLFDDNDFMNIAYSKLLTWFMITLLMLLFFTGLSWNFYKAFSLSMGVSLCITATGRYFLNKLISIFRKMGYDRRKVIFFGTNSEEIISKIRENKALGYELLIKTSDMDELLKYIDEADVVFITKHEIDDDMLKIIFDHDKIQWKVVSSAFNLIVEPVSFDEFKDYPIVNFSTNKLSKGYLLQKRMLDLIISGTGIVLLSPLFLTVAAIIKITMPGPVFFRQERLGKNLKPFMLYKFRSMVVDADKKKKELKSETTGIFKLKDDPRVTRFGKFLRRTCIDELPQLFNIFLGDMSVVGPRPHLEIELENFKGWRMERFKVKPGLTGMWQVNGRHELNFDKAVLYDIYYIKHRSILLDLKIILKTIPSIIMSKGRY